MSNGVSSQSPFLSTATFSEHPAARRPLPFSVPPVPITVMPAALASCTAAIPTPPVAPWIMTASPGIARARWKRAR